MYFILKVRLCVSTASLLLKSQKYQEEYKKPTLYTEHQRSSDLVHSVFWGFPHCVCRSAHAQNGGHMKHFLIVNFLKSSRTTYAQFLIFLNIHQHRSPDNFFSKSVRQFLKYFSKFPFLIFSLICKKLSYRFVLICKNIYFYPKLKW